MLRRRARSLLVSSSCVGLVDGNGVDGLAISTSNREGGLIAFRNEHGSDSGTTAVIKEYISLLTHSLSSGFTMDW